MLKITMGICMSGVKKPCGGVVVLGLVKQKRTKITRKHKTTDVLNPLKWVQKIDDKI